MIGNILMKLASFSIQKTIIFGLILAGGYFMFAYDNGSTVIAKIADVDKKLEEQQRLSKQSDASLKEVELVRATVGELGEQFQTVSNALPRNIEYAEVTRIIDFISRKSGVSVKSRESRPEINRDYFAEVPLKVIVEGNFTELVYFLNLLGQTVRIMKVNDFVISVPQSSTKAIPNGRLVLDGEIVSFKFLGKASALSNDPSKAGGKK